MKRGFVRIVNAGKVLQLTGAGFLVEPFRVALLTDLDGSVDVDLDKRQLSLDMQGANGVAIFSVRTNKAGHGNGATVGEQLGNLANAADVLFPVRRGETKVLVEAMADVVAVQHIGQPATLDQGMFQREGDGALAGAAQACEPQGRSLLTQEGPALLPGNMAFVPSDVGCFDRRHGSAFSQ